MAPRTRKGADEGTQLAIMGDGMGEAEAEEAVNKIFDQDSDEGWNEVKIGIGDKLTLTQGQWTPPLTYLGRVVITEGQGIDPGDKAPALTFCTQDGEAVFLWETYQLAQAFKDIREGTITRVKFLGMAELEGSSQRVGRYRVQARNAPAFVATDDPNEEPF